MMSPEAFGGLTNFPIVRDYPTIAAADTRTHDTRADWRPTRAIRSNMEDDHDPAFTRP
jgi:hypothetical protein